MNQRAEKEEGRSSIHAEFSCCPCHMPAETFLPGSNVSALEIPGWTPPTCKKKKVIFLLCLVLIPSAQNLPHFQQHQPQCWPFLTGLNLPQRAESQTHSSRDTNPLDFSAVAHNPCREQTKNHKHRQHRGTQADGGGIMRAVKFKPNPSLPSLCWLPALPLP